jgi:hypothetical protein
VPRTSDTSPGTPRCPPRRVVWSDAPRLARRRSEITGDVELGLIVTWTDEINATGWADGVSVTPRRDRLTYRRSRRIWSSHLPLSRNLRPFHGHTIKPPIIDPPVRTRKSHVFRDADPCTGFPYVLTESDVRRPERAK